MLVDALIVAVLGTAIWRGAKRGLLRSLTGLVGFVMATAAAVFGFRLLARPLEATGLSAGAANLVGALAIFVIVMAGVHVAGGVLRKAIKWTHLRYVDTAGGAAISGLWALSWVTAVLFALSVIPAPEAIATRVESSTLGTAIVEEAPRVLTSVAHDELRRALRFFTPPAEQSVSIVATDTFTRDDSAARALLDLINAEREAAGMSALRWDGTLARAGRSHVADMYRHGYFGHEGRDGSTPGERISAAGAEYRWAGENLALAPNVRTAHARLMASTKHRAHILDVRFDRVGIGVMIGRQGLLIAQEFTG